jgi:hypothetical protein
LLVANKQLLNMQQVGIGFIRGFVCHRLKTATATQELAANRRSFSDSSRERVLDPA